jgi:hypothetical protein
MATDNFGGMECNGDLHFGVPYNVPGIPYSLEGQAMSTDEVDEPSSDTVIWRYMKFERVVSMIEHHSLWFARPCKFDDRWEGLYPPSYYRNDRKWASDNNVEWAELEEDFTKRWKRYRYATFVNCWHVNDHESDAMWRLYGAGIAIQSTVGRVTECLPIDKFGRVRYYDPEKDVTYKSIFGKPDILHKRISFAHECELRAWIVDGELTERINRNEDFDVNGLSPGKSVPIRDMERLVEKMVVAPGTRCEDIENVKDVCSRCKMEWLRGRVSRSYLDRLHSEFLRYTR